MSRFKRSLHSQPHPIAVKATKTRDLVLHEGFAIPQGQAVVAVRDNSLQPPAEPNPEVKPYSRGSYGKAMWFAADPPACRAALLGDALASTSKGPLASRIKRWEQIAKQAGFPDPFDLSPDLSTPYTLQVGRLSLCRPVPGGGEVLVHPERRNVVFTASTCCESRGEKLQARPRLPEAGERSPLSQARVCSHGWFAHARWSYASWAVHFAGVVVVASPNRSLPG